MGYVTLFQMLMLKINKLPTEPRFAKIRSVAFGLKIPFLFCFVVLSISWNVIPSERSQFLHLFLYARGLLSAGVRMNVIGPYAAQQLLLHGIRPIVTAEAKQCGSLRTGF